MNVPALALGVIASNPDTVVLEERIDLFDPTTGAFFGSDVTYLRKPPFCTVNVPVDALTQAITGILRL